MQWPAGIGAKGNEGVANNVAQTKGSIGYVEYAYAKQNKLTYTKMINKAGKTVSPTVGDLPGRRRQRRLEQPAGLRRHPDQPAGRPVLADHGRDLHPDLQEAAEMAAATAEALKFFAWAYAKGDEHGQGARLRADAGQGRRRHPEDVGVRHQGRAAASRCFALTQLRCEDWPEARRAGVLPRRSLLARGLKVSEVALNDTAMSVDRTVRRAQSRCCGACA